MGQAQDLLGGVAGHEQAGQLRACNPTGSTCIYSKCFGVSAGRLKWVGNGTRDPRAYRILRVK